MRILHLADVHLDTPFASRTEAARRRLRDATREAFRRAMDLALSADVDAVLIAGDLFDGSRLSVASEIFLRNAFLPLGEAGITVVYVTGNHDPGSGVAGGARLDWPDHVHVILDDTPRTVQVMRGGTCVGTISGIGHGSNREDRDLSVRLQPPSARTVPAVALLHTQVTGARDEGAHDRYAPSEIAKLKTAGFDYWALGHVHTRQILSDLPGIAYPGNLQGRSPRETGARGGFMVELGAPGTAPIIRFVELAPLRWERLVLDDIGDLESAETLSAHAERCWTEAREAEGGAARGDVHLRVELSGPSPLYSLLSDETEQAYLSTMLAARLGVLEVELRADDVRPGVDPTEALERGDAVGEALRMIRALGSQGGPSPSVRLGIRSEDLAGRADLNLTSTAALDAYLRELLVDGDRVALERFLALGEGSAPDRGP